jgi:hypothetical protein
MHDDEAARREHIRRWVRPDFERFLRHDWERYVTPAGRDAVRRRIAECKAAFEPPQARRLREENEARERERQAALEAQHQCELEREALELKAELAALRVELLWAELRRKAGFNPDQPRVPACHGIESGRWADGASAPREGTRVAQYSFGTLIGQSRVRGGGWVCFYKFSFGTIMVSGMTNLGCQTWVTSAGVTHGKLIANDN